MKLVLLHARVLTLELLRYPAFLVPTLLFPAAFFAIFVPSGPADPATGMATFAGFAAIGVAFFQFGVGIAVERESAWEAYLRTLPVGPATRIGARLVSAAVFASATAAVVVGVALATTSPALGAARWGELAATLLVGTAPFALLGIALGYWAPQKGALPIANVLYLGLSYAGGLWIPPSELPRVVAALSPLLPTRSLADALAASVSGHPFSPGPLARLAVFAVLFGVLALWGFRRDEGRHYR